MNQKSDPRRAIQDLIDSIRNIFKNYSKSSRERAWEGLQSPDGRKAVQKLIRDPRVPITGVSRFISFKEWINS